MPKTGRARVVRAPSPAKAANSNRHRFGPEPSWFFWTHHNWGCPTLRGFRRVGIRNPCWIVDTELRLVLPTLSHTPRKSGAPLRCHSVEKEERRVRRATRPYQLRTDAGNGWPIEET